MASLTFEYHSAAFLIFQFQSVAFRIRPTGKKPRTTVLKAFFVAHLFVGGCGKPKFEVLFFENRDLTFHNRQPLAHKKKYDVVACIFGMVKKK